MPSCRKSNFKIVRCYEGASKARWVPKYLKAANIFHYLVLSMSLLVTTDTMKALVDISWPQRAYKN